MYLDPCEANRMTSINTFRPMNIFNIHRSNYIFIIIGLMIKTVCKQIIEIIYILLYISK